MKDSAVKRWLFVSSLALGCLFVSGLSLAMDAARLCGEVTEAAVRMPFLVAAGGLVLVLCHGILVSRLIWPRIAFEQARNKELTEAVAQLSHMDELTKAFTRLRLESELERLGEAVRRYGLELSAVMLDLDDISGINADHGYRVGDKVLFQAARKISRHVRKTDSLFRWAGGRFVVLAPHIDEAKAAVLAQKLRDLLARETFEGGVRLCVEASAAQMRENDSVESFMARLKAALRPAEGRNADDAMAAA